MGGRDLIGYNLILNGESRHALMPATKPRKEREEELINLRTIDLKDKQID